MRFLKGLAALAVGLVLTAFLAEALVLLAVGEVPKFPRRVVEAPWGLRYNEPGAAYRHKSADVSVRFRINAEGMRAERDYPYAKPAGVTRILSLGDSFTIGYEVERGECFSSVVERELRAAGIDAEVINAGVSGFSNAEECLYLERELLKYDPDLVIVSFYTNDLKDNVRSRLFRFDDSGRLEEWNERYVPAGRLGNFLNTSRIFNWLSERSNAFVFLKERGTLVVRAIGVRRGRGGAMVSDKPSAADRTAEYQRLAAAVFDRMVHVLRDRETPLLIQSIPRLDVDRTALVDSFPYELVDRNRPALDIVVSRDFLTPHLGKERLYWQRSMGHWTPFAHELSGKAIARRILEKNLLGPSPVETAMPARER
ncbi:hypothetical protein K8I85_18865 [bacterium]|nr:hypothetical protein [bacterium]